MITALHQVKCLQLAGFEAALPKVCVIRPGLSDASPTTLTTIILLSMASSTLICAALALG